MTSALPRPTRWRFIRAYTVTGQILWRYFFLVALSKVFGRQRMAPRWEAAHRKTARQVKANILQLKGLFIKVGQMLSIMTHFLPATITQELEGLQDSVPPAPYDQIEERFVEEFKKKPAEFFARFDTAPIASASLGQVHVAHDRQGNKLAVKVQYPDIEAIVRIDLKTLKRIFGIFHFIFPQYGLKKTYGEIREIVLEELDFTREGKNLEMLAQNFGEETDLLFPKVFWEFSTQRVLTLQFMEGVKISNLKSLKELQVAPTEVAKKIIHAYCRQIFIDGVYHADPHPGNFLVQASEEDVERWVEPETEDGEGRIVVERKTVPKIVMMDFGAVARISEGMRKGIAKFIEGIIKRDNQVISQAMKEMGFIAKTENEEVFDRIVAFFYERLKDLKFDEIKNLQIKQFQHLEDILEIRKLDVSWKDLLQTFNVPKDWALLERTLLLLVGLTTHLDPDLNPLSIIIPYAEEFVLGKDRNFADLMLDAVKEIALSYLKLPNEIERTLRKLNQGELELNFKNSEAHAKRMSAALNRLSYVILVLGSLAFGVYFQREGFEHFRYFYYGSGFFGFLLSVNLITKRL